MVVRWTLPDPYQVTIRNVMSQVEQRKRNRGEWTQYEEGNLLADAAGSPTPEQMQIHYPTSILLSIRAAYLVFLFSLGIRGTYTNHQ